MGMAFEFRQFLVLILASFSLSRFGIMSVYCIEFPVTAVWSFFPAITLAMIRRQKITREGERYSNLTSVVKLLGNCSEFVGTIS